MPHLSWHGPAWCQEHDSNGCMALLQQAEAAQREAAHLRQDLQERSEEVHTVLQRSSASEEQLKVPAGLSCRHETVCP